MRRGALGLSLALALGPLGSPGRAESGSPESKAGLRTQARPSARLVLLKSLPKGWREAPGKRPAGVAVVVRGPIRSEGTPVVALRPWPRPIARPETTADVGALAKAAGIEAGFTRMTPDPSGAVVLDAPAQDGLVVRHVLHPRGLLTIAAPARLLPSTSAWVLKALERLPPTQ